MLTRAAKAGRIAFAGLLALCTAAVPGSATTAAPALHWSAIGPHGGGVFTLVPAAGGAGVLWTAIAGTGLWKSIDGGASWAQAPLLPPQAYSTVVTDPVDPLTVYALGSAGLAKTTDGGATWKLIDPTPFGELASAPGAPRTLYLASEEFDRAAMSRSDDGGATWRPLAPLPGTVGIYEVDVDPSNPDGVFVVGFQAPASFVTLHSADGGQSWSSVDVPGGYLATLRWDPRAPGTILALNGRDPVRSRDGGATWETVRAGLPFGSSVAGMALDRSSGTVYLAVETAHKGEIWASADDGASWEKRSEYPGGLAPLAVDGALPGRLYAGAGDGSLLASADAGRHWQVAGPGFVPPAADDLVPDPLAAGTLYALLSPHAGSGGGPPLPPQVLARSRDGGATWTSWTLHDPSGNIIGFSQLVLDPFVAGSIYGHLGPRFYHNADGGPTWAVTGAFPAECEEATSVVADPLHPGVFFAAGFWSQGGTAVLRSADHGQSWTPVLILPKGETAVDVVRVDPSSPAALFAAGRGGLWRSLDGGQTWGSSLGAGLPKNDQWVVRLETDAGDNLYAELRPAGPHALYKSADRGATWAPSDAGLPAGILVNDLLPRGTTLYAATSAGVYVSQNGGASWAAENDGLASTWVNRLAAPAGSGGLFAATEGGLAVSPPPAAACPASDTVLCLAGGRFALQVHWMLADGTAGDAHASPLTDGSGGFWFFSPESLERMVKVVDGRAVNGHFWLFGGLLSDVASTLTVTDVATGATRTYRNPRGRLTSFADTSAFATVGAASRAVEVPTALPAPGVGAAVNPGINAPCVPAADTLCLADSRFAVRVTWRLPGGTADSATAVPLFQNTGAFWFFAAGNPELSVKVLDGRTVNGHFWVFLAGLSSVDYTATVTDTASGSSKSYRHPAGAPASSADTAF